MPAKQEHRTQVHDRVRIKDTVTHMYPHARVWSEGTVMKRMHDHHGYPLIWIEWDKDHWAYSGEEDRWVLEAHFDVVENTMAEEDKPDFMDALWELMQQHRKDTGREEPKPKDTRPTGPLSYEDILNKGYDAAEKGEAFILVVASPEVFNETEVVIPRIYLHSKNDPSALLLDAAVADYVAQAMGRLIQRQDDGSASS